jgi:hypothetical protein
MNLKGMQQRRSTQPGTVMGLDDAEMALTIVDLERTLSVVYTAPVRSYDLLCELQSAASMIMDRTECEALVRELEGGERGRRFAA